MFSLDTSSPVPLDEPDVLQNLPNEQLCRKTNPSARNVRHVPETEELAKETLG